MLAGKKAGAIPVGVVSSQKKRLNKQIGVVTVIFVIAAVIIAIIAALSFHEPAYAVHVNLPDGCWSGSIGIDTDSATYDGCGDRMISLSGQCRIGVVAVVQKGFDEVNLEPYPGTLTVEIFKDGTVVKTGSTSADYGALSVMYSC